MPTILSVARERLWTPVTDAGRGDGFAVEAADWFRQIIAPGTKRLDELRDAACLVLLGEPGMGKTTTLGVEQAGFAAAAPEDHRVVLANLNRVSSDAGLDEIFDQEAVAAWRADTGTLHLFVDSFDESLGRYRALTARFLDHLGGLPRERLRLRLACRSGDIPGQLVEELRVLWPDVDDQPSVRVLLLEPLSRKAVRQWAAQAGVDSEAFLAEVHRRNGRSFAARPITLGPLIHQYRQGRFPTSEVELYRASCLALCEEINPARDREPELSPEERFAIAERVAILMSLSGKSVVWLGDPALAPADAISLSSLIGGPEVVQGAAIDVDRAALREILSCALFAAQDYQLMRWSQQVYTEFLAANYFARRLPEPWRGLQFLEQPGRPGTTDRRIAPQMAEVVAWLAAMDDDVARWIAKCDPVVLLRAQHYLPPSVRPDLVGWWLAEEGAGRNVGERAWLDQIGSRLDHAGISDQLRAVLNDRGIDLRARELACDLAGAAPAVALADDLAGLALDAGEPLDVRWRAARALGGQGFEAERVRLIPLAEDAAGTEPAGHLLRAFAMATLWPEHLSTESALDILAQHKSGARDEYGLVFEAGFIRALAGQQAASALDWVASRADEQDGALVVLIGEIFESAAHHLSEDDVPAALARAMLARVRPHAYVLDRNADEVQAALREQALVSRLGLADELAAGVVRDGDYFELDRWIVALDLPCLDIIARAAGAVGPALGLWMAVLRADPRTWVDAAWGDELQRAAEVAVELIARQQLSALATQVVTNREQEELGR